MAALTRKQREIQEREALILDVARGMLLERGYLGMTMDRIAEATEYSKGTIYQHFHCKEEVLAAMAIETAEKRTSFFERASALRGRSRERMIALGEAIDLFVALYPHHFRAEQIIVTSSIRDKTSPERFQRLLACDGKCMGIAAGIVRDGVSQGDVVLREGVTPEKLSFGLWASSWGVYSVLRTEFPLAAIGIDDPLQALWVNSTAMLDGHGWKPLSDEWDYQATRRRIREEIFGEEYRTLEGRESDA